MKSSLFMNCLWYEDISPEELVEVLGISSEQLYRKIFQEEDFTFEEIKKISCLLGLTKEEIEMIFF